nr:arsenate reductase (glutaredoxin) [uncultured Gellertiella sp.]
MDTRIYHNPACGTSRNTLAMIRNAGIEPEIIDYVTTPPDKEALRTMIAAAGLSVREALREKEAVAATLGLDRPEITDEVILDAMLAHPILLNRPFVITPLGTRLCRPSQQVLEILPDTHRGPFSKEDGEVVLDASGKRI